MNADPEPRATVCGALFDLQRYAVHDGPGIRTLVFLKGCPLACVWCANPESQRDGLELMRSRARCVGCATCAGACLEPGALTMGEAGPALDRRRCEACAEHPCVVACPHDALTLVGRTVSAEAVVAEIARDRDFYRNSGGGVTFSGGEPFHQPAFLKTMLMGCKAAGITTAVETCGYAALEDILAAEPWLDLFLYDLKGMDAATHRATTGVSPERIHENLAALAARCPEKVVVRLCVVPGLTDGAGELRDLAAFVAGLGLSRLELVPYHSLGTEKYAGLGRRYACAPDPTRLDRAELERLLRAFETRGLRCEEA